MKGRQETIKDVIIFITNVVAFARDCVKINEEPSSQPTLIQIFVSVVDIISTFDFKNFSNKHISSKPFIPHTLITYLFNIAFIFIKMAKDHKHFRWVVHYYFLFLH